MQPERLQAEIAIRELPCVAYVGWRISDTGSDTGSQVAVQLVVTDPDVAAETSDRARQILTRHHPDADVRVDVRVSGVPRTDLMFERQPPSTAHGNPVVALRGHRGELLRLASLDAPATGGVPDDERRV